MCVGHEQTILRPLPARSKIAESLLVISRTRSAKAVVGMSKRSCDRCLPENKVAESLLVILQPFSRTRGQSRSARAVRCRIVVDHLDKREARGQGVAESLLVISEEKREGRKCFARGSAMCRSRLRRRPFTCARRWRCFDSHHTLEKSGPFKTLGV